MNAVSFVELGRGSSATLKSYCRWVDSRRLGRVILVDLKLSTLGAKPIIRRRAGSSRPQ